MNKKTILTVLKSIAIILVLVAFAFLLRAQTVNLAPIPADQQDYFLDPDGLPYFTEMDSYYNLRLTQNYVDHGTLGDTVKNGSDWDSLSYAPPGRAIEYTPLIIYVTSFLYYIANLITEMSLTEVAYWASAIIAPLSAIPAYIIVRRITNDYGGITAGVLVALSPNFFSHTFAGFFDTDMFTVLIPLVMMLFFIESIKASKFSYRLIAAILTILSIALFSLAWTGYIFYAAMLVGVILVYLLLGFVLKMDLVKPRQNYSNFFTWFINQKEIFAISFIIIVGFIGLGLLNGFNSIPEAISGLFGATQLQALSQATSYPNVYISVAELQVPNLLYGGIAGAFLSNAGGVVNGVGGIVALFGALIILFLFAQRLWILKSFKGKSKSKKPPKGQRKAAAKVQAEKNKESLVESTLENIKSIDDVNDVKRETLFYLTLFSVWILGSAIAVTQGSRFIQVLMIPLGLCVGIFVGYAVDYVKIKVNSDSILMTIATIGTLLIAYPVYTLVGMMPNGLLYTLALSIGLIAVSAIAIYGIKGGKWGKRGKSIFNKFSKAKDSENKGTPIKKLIVVVILTLALISPTVISAYQTANGTVPSTSDPMWDSMLWVKANTTNDTVVTSWWDFGYLFEIAGERRVTFDGGSQNSPRAFWVGKAMTEDNPDLSAGIFEMLASSGDEGYYTLDNYTNDTGKSVEILEKTLPVSRDEAKTIMTGNYNLSSTQADDVLQYTHPANATPVVFVASSDLLQKAGWWSYFGTWDFKIQNSSGYQYLVSQEAVELEKINSTTAQANITNSEEQNILFQTVLTKDLETNNTTATVKTVYENGSQVIDQNGTPYNPFTLYNRMIIDDGYVVVNETVNESGNFTLLIIGNNNTYNSILMSKELENSLFTRLFILGGFGQDRFELVNMEPGVSLWKIIPKS